MATDGAVLQQFGVGTGYQYLFPIYQERFSPRFGRARNNLSPISGGGAYDPNGAGRAALESGQVSVSFTIKSSTRAAMEAQRDALLHMHGWGLQPLIMQPSDGGDGIRYCWARVGNIDAELSPSGQTDLHQPVSCTFDVPHPRWYGREGLAFIGDGSPLETSISMVGERVANQTVNDGDTISVTNNGNAPADLLLIWRTSGSGYRNPGLRRYDRSGLLVESVQYLGTLLDGDDLYIDGRAKATQPGAAYAQLTTRTPDWLTVPPGTTTLEVFGLGSSSAVLSLDWMDEWT